MFLSATARLRASLGALLSVVGIAVFFSACASVKLKPLEADEISGSVIAAFQSAYSESPELKGSLSIEEAIARSLKFNLDQRVQRMEQAVALNIWEAGKYDMLPRALATAGYSARDKDLIRNSIDSVTGEPSLANPFISSDRSASRHSLGMSWSVLDFTMGYLNARQNADRVLIAGEQRRRAIHNLTKEVTTAYWRMVSAQQLLDHVREVGRLAEKALQDSRTLEKEGLNAPLENLRYQRQILENIRLLASIEKEFSTARIHLANLINVPLHEAFHVEEPDWQPSIRILEIPVKEMEEIALVENAEMREHLYRERIASKEVRRAMASMFPNLSFNYDLMHSDDSFLINHSWSDAGAAISQNLAGLLAMPKRKRLAKSGVELEFQRRVALQMAVLAKVHIARLELASSYRQLELANELWGLDQSIKELSANWEDAETESQLTRVAAEVSSIVSMMRRYQALAEFNASVGTLQSTLGMQLEVDSLDGIGLSELTSSVRKWRSSWHERVLSLGVAETMSM